MQIAKVTYEEKVEHLFNEAMKDPDKKKKLMDLIIDAEFGEITDHYLEAFGDNGWLNPYI